MKVSQSVLGVLDASITDGSLLTLPAQLDRALYVQTNKVLEAAGGKWVSKKKGHVFAGNAEDAIEQILLTGEILVAQDFGFFETPDELALEIVRMADVKPGMRALEPNAGRGRIVKHLNAAGAKVYAVELLKPNVDALLTQGMADSVLEADFLGVELDPRSFDRVVMNPPFSKQADVKHVMRAMDYLKPDGILVAIMSFGVSFRADKLSQQFRSTVYERGGLIEPLPEGSFKQSGTMVNTVVVTVPGA